MNFTAHSCVYSLEISQNYIQYYFWSLGLWMLFFSPCREHHPAWRASIRILLYFVYCALPLFFWPDRLWLAVWRCSTWKQTKSGIRSLSFSLNISTTTQNVELGSAFWGMFFVHTVRFNTHSFNSDIMLVWCLNHRFPLPKKLCSRFHLNRPWVVKIASTIGGFLQFFSCQWNQKIPGPSKGCPMEAYR